MQIFISHSSKDGDVANKLCAFLEEKGLKCFLAPRDIRLGKEYAEEIINGIEQSDALVLLMSKDANQSPHVLREVERAVSKEVPIFVYKLEEVELSKSMEYFLMTHQWLDVNKKNDFSTVWHAVCGLKNEGAHVEQVSKPAKKRRIWLVVLAVLILLAAGFGVWKFSDWQRMEQAACLYEVGDTVTFGSYNGEPIDWRVLRLSEDGTQAVLIAKDILTIKAFDAAESGTYNMDGDEDYWMRESPADTDLELQLRVRGNNDWSVSNIRTWLNSAEEVVVYADQAPTSAAMSEKRNGYHNEPGFLCGFSDEELAAILPTTIETKGNGLVGGIVTTEDLVYLLSVEELAWFDEAGISKYTTPTQAAIEQDQSNWYAIEISEFGIKEYYWWLREPVEGTTGICYMVNNGYTQDTLLEANVGLEGYGIRPAVTVDLQADCFVIEK